MKLKNRCQNFILKGIEYDYWKQNTNVKLNESFTDKYIIKVYCKIKKWKNSMENIKNVKKETRLHNPV